MTRVLEPLELTGGETLPNRVLPGPMEGVMTNDFCRIMMEFDLVSVWITPFVRILDSVPRPSILRKRLEQYQGRPIIVQLMGTNRQSLATAAGEVMRFDGVIGVELNCACPSSKVLQSGAGSALLADPSWIRDTLLAFRDAVPEGGLGVKVRSGLDSPDEVENIISAVAEGKPDYAVMHYRTAKEMYRRIPDGWQRFKAAKKGLGSIPLLASGDLLTVDDCRELLGMVNVDGITPARGLLKNPWLLRDVEASLSNNQSETHSVIPFLIRLVELGQQRPNWRPGNVLDIAKMAWGETSEEFRALLGKPLPGEILKTLQSLVQQR